MHWRKKEINKQETITMNILHPAGVDAVSSRLVTFCYLIAPLKGDLLREKCKSNISMLTNAMQCGIPRYQAPRATLRIVKSFIAIRCTGGRIFICAHASNTRWNMYTVFYENPSFNDSLSLCRADGDCNRNSALSRNWKLVYIFPPHRGITFPSVKSSVRETLRRRQLSSYAASNFCILLKTRNTSRLRNENSLEAALNYSDLLPLRR